MTYDERTGHLGSNRRDVLKSAGALGLIATMPWAAGRAAALTGTTELDIPKWQDPLPRPGTLLPVGASGGVTQHRVELTEFDQPVLPESMGLQTTVWGYEGSYPGPTILARPERPVEVTYVNNLPGDHLLSVDPRVHGAEPPAPESRISTHLHGGVVAPESDGYPEAWVAPDGTTAADYPEIPDSPVPYLGTKQYPNIQEPATLWYHDHAIGSTRLNVYAGLAAFYLLRDTLENRLPSGRYHVPVVFQDRSFETDGSLFYPDGTDDEFEAEFFGDVPVVNGKAYPFVEVEPRSYRFRLLNGSNGRTFDMTFRNDTGTADDVPLIQQIATDLGFLESVVTIGPGGDLPSLLLSGAERADVVVDFSGFEGQTLTLTNDAETPYAGENSGSDMPELLQFRVGETATVAGGSMGLGRFLDRIDARYPDEDVPDSGVTRYMTLDTGAIEVEPGVLYDTHFLNQSLWADEAAVERPALGTSEAWVLANVTGDSHPIHLHLVDFEVVGRQAFDAAAFDAAREAGEDPAIADHLVGDLQPPAANEVGPKDTVLVNPAEAAWIRPEFTDFAGHYVWHCHILEHEDQEMMLPYVVVD